MNTPPRGLVARLGARSPRGRATLAALALLGADAAVLTAVAMVFALSPQAEGSAAVAIRFAAYEFTSLAAIAAVTVLLIVQWFALPRATDALRPSRDTARGGAMGFVAGGVLVATAFALAVACHGYRVALSAASQRPSAATMLVLAVATAMGAAWEELMFRGGLVGALSEAFPRPVAVLVPALLFGLAHATNPGASVVSVANTVLAGALFGCVYLGAVTPGRGASLGWAVGLHAGWNYVLGPVLSIPVSGFPPVQRWLEVQPVHALWSGGSYGLEAGLATTLVLGPATVLAAWRVLRPRPAT